MWHAGRHRGPPPDTRWPAGWEENRDRPEIRAEMNRTTTRRGRKRIMGWRENALNKTTTSAEAIAAAEERTELRNALAEAHNRINELEIELADERNTYGRLDNDYRKLQANTNTTPAPTMPVDAVHQIDEALYATMLDHKRATSRTAISGYANHLVYKVITGWFG